jgi:hypothetical protein
MRLLNTFNNHMYMIETSSWQLHMVVKFKYWIHKTNQMQTLLCKQRFLFVWSTFFNSKTCQTNEVIAFDSLGT